MILSIISLFASLTLASTTTSEDPIISKEAIEQSYSKKIVHLALTPNESKGLDFSQNALLDRYFTNKEIDKKKRQFVTRFMLRSFALLLVSAGGYWVYPSDAFAVSGMVGGLLALTGILSGTISSVSIWWDIDTLEPKDRLRFEQVYFLVQSRVDHSCRRFGGVSREVTTEFETPYHKDPKFTLYPVELTLEDFRFGRVYLNGEKLSIQQGESLELLGGSSYIFADNLLCNMGWLEEPVYLNRIIEL